jgi:putative transposase
VLLFFSCCVALLDVRTFTQLMKTSYHPAITVAFYLNCLPPDLVQYIPRSTRFDWQHKDKSTYFGYEWFCQNQQLFQTLKQVSSNKKLLLINKALIRIIAIKRFITNYISCLRENRLTVTQTVIANIAKVTAIFGLTKTLRFIQIPYSAYLKLKRVARCNLSPLHLCMVKHPTQLIKKEVAVIKQYCTDTRFLHWPLSSVYEMIKREGAAYFNVSTFYKYVNLLNLKRSRAANRRRHHHTGIRASAPLQIIHADVTIFRTADNHKNYIHLIQDNFSRAILQPAVQRNCTAQTTFENLNSVYEKYLHPADMEDCLLISDDGSENYGPVKAFIENSQYPIIQHLIAQRDIEFSNSMIEAANKQLKYRFLYHHHIADYDALVKYVEQSVNDYNNRPHHVLHGLTPFEVLQGQIPNPQAYAEQTQQSKANRLIENKKIKCCYHSF